MPLIHKAIKYGAMYGIAKEVTKPKEQNNSNTQVPMPQGQYYQQPPPPQQGQMWRDKAGYLHQAWCNGQCGHQCNGNVSRSVEPPQYSGGASVSAGPSQYSGGASRSAEPPQYYDDAKPSGRSNQYYSSGKPSGQ